jgi:hypothetical protein
MTFRKLITTIKNNEDELLGFFGYDNITSLKLMVNLKIIDKRIHMQNKNIMTQ